MTASYRRRLGICRRNVLILGATALLTFLLVASDAFAFTLTVVGYQSKQIPVDRVTYVGYAYLTPAANAAASWTNAGVGITVTSPGANRIYTEYRADTWYGLYDHLTHGGPQYHTCTAFRIVVNTMMCDSLTATGKQSVICHELGHAVGLGEGDVPIAVMRQTRNRELIYTPKTDDKQGANASWMR